MLLPSYLLCIHALFLTPLWRLPVIFQYPVAMYDYYRNTNWCDLNKLTLIFFHTIQKVQK